MTFGSPTLCDHKLQLSFQNWQHLQSHLCSVLQYCSCMNETSKADVFLWWWSLDGKCWLCSRGERERAAKDLWASPEPKWRKWHWDLKLSLTLLVSTPLNKSSIKTWVVMTTCIPLSPLASESWGLTRDIGCVTEITEARRAQRSLCGKSFH